MDRGTPPETSLRVPFSVSWHEERGTSRTVNNVKQNVNIIFFSTRQR